MFWRKNKLFWRLYHVGKYLPVFRGSSCSKPGPPNPFLTDNSLSATQCCVAPWRYLKWGNVFSPNPGKAMKKAKAILKTYEVLICGDINSKLIL